MAEELTKRRKINEGGLDEGVLMTTAVSPILPVRALVRRRTVEPSEMG